jgi:hypothetical protein
LRGALLLKISDDRFHARALHPIANFIHGCVYDVGVSIDEGNARSLHAKNLASRGTNPTSTTGDDRYFFF